jgi:hypothetical protein
MCVYSGDEEGAVRLLPLHRVLWRLQQHIRARGGAPIVTCDAPLAEAPGHRARIEVIA